MSALQIKPVTSDRFDEIWLFFQQIIRAGESYPLSPSSDFEHCRDYWFAPGAYVYHAYFDGHAVGSRYIVANKPGLGSHICNTGVVIDPAFQGRGFGGDLNRFAIDEARRLGFLGIQLNLVVETNLASIKICKENGFVEIGRIPCAFHLRQENYVDALIMYRSL